jgi:hypothetical protein
MEPTDTGTIAVIVLVPVALEKLDPEARRIPVVVLTPDNVAIYPDDPLVRRRPVRHPDITLLVMLKLTDCSVIPVLLGPVILRLLHASVLPDVITTAAVVKPVMAVSLTFTCALAH